MFSIRRIFVARHFKGGSPLPKLSKKLFSSQSKADDWNINWTAVKVVTGTIFGALVAGLSVYSSSKELAKDMTELLPESIPPAFEKACVTSSNAKAKYISRPDVEDKISQFLISERTRYCVVYGSKGIGKSEVIDHTAIGKRSVVKVPVTTIGTRDDLVALIMEALTGKRTNLNIVKLIEVLNKCNESGFIPTIIFNVERASSSDRPAVLQDVRSLAKALIGYCRCIIVLSEANAVLELGKDKRRENFIFVNEMTEPEAKQFLEVRGAKFSDIEMRYIFDSIGTSPVTLIDLMTEVPKIPLKDYIENVLGDAYQDFVNFPLKPILKALKEHPEGISPDYFKNQEYKGINMSVPAKAMKSSNAIIYRIELRKYQLMSTAHKTALKTYNPEQSNFTTK